MHEQQWNQFRQTIRRDLTAELPSSDLNAHLSATAGLPLTPEQYGELAMLDTDIVVANGQQYGFGWTPSGFKLFNVVHPVEMTVAVRSSVEEAVAA